MACHYRIALPSSYFAAVNRLGSRGPYSGPRWPGESRTGTRQHIAQNWMYVWQADRPMSNQSRGMQIVQES